MQPTRTTAWLKAYSYLHLKSTTKPQKPSRLHIRPPLRRTCAVFSYNIIQESSYPVLANLQTKRTLRMLYNEHRKAGKELQRKIAKLREENKDPSLPQKPSKSSTPMNVATALPQPLPSPSLQAPQNNLADSQQAVDESFMLLGQRVCPSLPSVSGETSYMVLSRVNLAMRSTISGRSPKACSITCLDR